MNLRSIITPIFSIVIMMICVVHSLAQVRRSAHAMSASHVAAEVTNGKLNPTQSKPGDQVAMRLKNDLKSNGQLVLKKGTTITGVVRNVKTFDGKTRRVNHAQSLMEIEWVVPPTNGRVARELSIALQSVMQTSPLVVEADAQDDFEIVSSSAVPSLLVGVARVLPTSNAALLNMPSVVAADTQTTADLETTLGTPASGQLFKVGHGELVAANGTKQSLDIFSHLSNDTVITSPSKNFEISTGAQVQLLVGVNKQ